MTDNFVKTTQPLADGSTARMVYDREGDMLDIFFDKNEPARGIQLTDQILLRLDPTMERVVSLTILDYSLVTEETAYGRRSFPLTQLQTLPDAIHDNILRLISSHPLNQFLTLSHFHASPTQHIPLTYFEPQSALASV